MSFLDERGQGPINWQVNLAVLWTGVFLCCASYTMCIPFLPVFLLREMHVAASEVNFLSGIVFAITFIGSSVMAPYWGALADHVGQRKMAIRAGLGLAISYYLTGACQDIYQLFAVRAFCGIVAGFVPACMSLASSTLPESRMGWGMGLMQTAVASGSILGPLMGGYLSSWFGMRMSFYLSSGSLLFAACLVIFFVRDLPFTKEQQQEKVHLWQDLKLALQNKELVYIMTMFLIIQSCVMLVQPLITIYVGQLMGSTGDEAVKIAGVVFSLAGIAGILAATFWGRRGQRYGYIKIFCLVTFCAGFINLFQVFIVDVWQFAAIQFVYGLFLAGSVPNINANITLVTEKNMRGRAFGLVTAAHQFGGVLGPLLGGLLGGLMPIPWVLVCIGLTLMATAVYSYKTRVAGKG